MIQRSIPCSKISAFLSIDLHYSRPRWRGSSRAGDQQQQQQLARLALRPLPDYIGSSPIGRGRLLIEIVVVVVVVFLTTCIYYTNHETKERAGQMKAKSGGNRFSNIGNYILHKAELVATCGGAARGSGSVKWPGGALGLVTVNFRLFLFRTCGGKRHHNSL